MNLNSGDTPLVLLCPAWKKYGPAKSTKLNTTILHSRSDDVIPFADSEDLVRASGLPAAALIEIGTDHRLAEPEPLEAMLRACCRRAGNGSSMVPEIAAELTLLSTEEGGRRGPVVCRHTYRPHIVVGDPAQRSAITEAGQGIEDYFGVKFIDGPAELHPGETGPS